MNISNSNTGATLVETDYGVTVEWNNARNVRVTIPAAISIKQKVYVEHLTEMATMIS